MVNGLPAEAGRGQSQEICRRLRARRAANSACPPPVIAAFWALETDFGAVQGDFHTLDALVTLSHDCRRPELFRPQLMALLKLIDRGVAAARRQGRLGRRDRPDADPAQGLSRARRRRRRRRQGRPARQRAGRHHDHRQQGQVARLEAPASRGWRKCACPTTLPWEQTGRTNSLPLAQWSALGRHRPRRHAADRQRRCRPASCCRWAARARPSSPTPITTSISNGTSPSSTR